MPDEAMLESWKMTAEHLERARGSLTDPEDNELALYQQFLQHNELGLALDALVDVAAVQRAPRATWESLASAAESMQLGERDAVHQQSVLRIKEHLTASHDWFELRAMLNEWDPIGVYDPETDFPTDEYDCMYAPIMWRLRRDDGPSEIGDFLAFELSEHFGLDPAPSRPHDFAEKLATWFARRSSDRGPST